MKSIGDFFSLLEPGVWVAIVALLTSIVFAVQNWRHNKLTVRPNLDITRDTQSRPARILIASSGIGPAIVKKIEARIDGKVFELSTLEGMVAFFDDYEDILSGYSVMEDGVYLLPGQSKNILEFAPDGEATLGAFMAKLSFSLEWQSIYSENYSAVMKNVNELQQEKRA